MIEQKQQRPNITTYLEGRYILSYVLSFLDEKDGVNTLRTNKRWYRRMLPIFRIDKNTSNILSPNRTRYRFCILPVQDPYVLLQRLNTKRLAKRIVYYYKKNQSLSSSSLPCHDEHESLAYRYNMTTEEIAWYEWEDQQHKTFESSSFNTQQYRHPCHLELLRYCTPLTQHLSTTIPPSILSTSSSTHPIPNILPGVTLLVSYPRSGNTFLRTLLERMTNIVTGSDTRPDRALSQALALHHHLVGEGITSSVYTPIIKSHFPERLGYIPFTAQRIILLVRNPYDAMDSYWNMCCTNTHTQTVHESIYEKYAMKYQNLVHHEIQTWIRFHAYWLNPFLHTSNHENDDHDDDPMSHRKDDKEQNVDDYYDSGIPILVIRYEDLVLDTFKTMTRVLSFILPKDNPHEMCSSEDGDDPELDTNHLHPFWKRRLYYGLGLSLDSDSFSTNTTTTTTNNNNNSNPNSASISIDHTMTLGSYTPKIYETPIQDHVSNTSHYQSTTKSNLLLIGKALAKKRYSHETLQYVHNISSTLERNVLDSIYRYYYKSHHKTHSSTTSSSWLQLFGYDIMTQNFPNNFSHIQQQEQHQCMIQRINIIKRKKKNQNSIMVDHHGLVINTMKEGIRDEWDEFGRAMTDWRKGQTFDDTKPFPTIGKKYK